MPLVREPCGCSHAAGREHTRDPLRENTTEGVKYLVFFDDGDKKNLPERVLRV